MKRKRERGAFEQTEALKKKIKSSSAKAKGRRLQQWVCQKISDVTGYAWGPDELIASREMGQSGTDIRLTGRAREAFPFGIECRYRETWSLPEFVEQAKKYDKEGMISWLLFIKKNRHEPLVVMDAGFFFTLWEAFLHGVSHHDPMLTPLDIFEDWMEKKK